MLCDVEAFGAVVFSVLAANMVIVRELRDLYGVEMLLRVYQLVRLGDIC